MARNEKLEARKKLRHVEKILGKKLKKPVCAYSIYMQEFRQPTKDKNPKLTHP